MPPLRNAPSGTSEIEPPRDGLARAGRAPRAAASSSERSSGCRAVDARHAAAASSARSRGSPPGSSVSTWPGGRLRDAGEERARRRHVAERQVRPGSRSASSSRGTAGCGEHRLDLAAEHERAAAAPVVERLLAEAVAAEHEPLARARPRRAKANMPSSRRASATGSSVLGEVGDDLGVAAASRSAWPSRAQLVAQLAEVVDLAVEHDADRAVLVGDRRIAGHEVDDREAVLRQDAAAAGRTSRGRRGRGGRAARSAARRWGCRARGGRRGSRRCRT